MFAPIACRIQQPPGRGARSAVAAAIFKCAAASVVAQRLSRIRAPLRRFGMRRHGRAISAYPRPLARHQELAAALAPRDPPRKQGRRPAASYRYHSRPRPGAARWNSLPIFVLGDAPGLLSSPSGRGAGLARQSIEHRESNLAARGRSVAVPRETAAQVQPAMDESIGQIAACQCYSVDGGRAVRRATSL